MGIIATGRNDFVSLGLAIYGRMRGHHRLSNRQWDDLEVVPFVHQKLLVRFLSNDFKQAAFARQSHLESGEFNRIAKAAWKRRQRQGIKR